MKRPLAFTVTASDARLVREVLKKRIKGAHIGIDGTYEEGVIDTIAWLLGKQDFIAYSGWLKQGRSIDGTS